MKLVRFGAAGSERPGIIGSDGKRRDCSSHFSDWNHDFFHRGGLAELRELAVKADSLPIVADDERWGAPVARPYKILAIGLNYSDHAAEAGLAIPKEPILFQKATSSICGPYDPILIPPDSEKTDWEVELAVIISRDCRRLKSFADAAAVIAGYAVANDVSERHWQAERGGQWTKGKSSDNFFPLGPWMSTADEISDPQNLDMVLDVNGRRCQTGNTNKMIFNIHHIVWYLSQFLTLEAGDVITTGTPPGVGLGMKPPTFLKVGDEVRLSIVGLGEQLSRCQVAE
ncbi:MAG: fumarylacetoacetate hydrolase family protein [Pirellulales bacterium]